MSLDDSQITSDGWIRASDRDRDAAMSVLRDAYVAGRLDLRELHDRITAACTARTWGDLRNLTADLPAWPDEARWLEHLRTKALAGHNWVTSKPRRPFAPMGLMGLVWLSIAAAAPTLSARAGYSPGPAGALRTVGRLLESRPVSQLLSGLTVSRHRPLSRTPFARAGLRQADTGS